MTVLLGQSTTGVSGANSNAAGIAFGQRLQALATGTITSIWLFTGATGPSAGNVHGAIYADNAGALSGATRLSGDITGNFAANQWIQLAVSPGVPVTAGSFYWIEWLGVGATFNYTNFAASGGTEKDTSAQSSCPATHATTTGTNANIENTYADGDVASSAVASPLLSMILRGGLQRAQALQLIHPPIVAGVAPTLLSDSDSATGSDTGTVSATMPGSESATGTDAQASLSVTASDSEAGAATDTGAVAASLSSTESGSGTDTTGALNVTLPGSDSGTGTDTGGAPQVTGSSTDTGLGTDTGTVSATLAGSDSGVGVDDGMVVDISGGATPVSGSDSGVGTDSGVVVDITPPDEEDRGDESAVFGEPVRVLLDTDAGTGIEVGRLVDLTPVKLPPLRVKFPIRRLSDGDTGVAVDDQALTAAFVDTDAGRAKETSDLQISDPQADIEDRELLMVIGLLSDD